MTRRLALAATLLLMTVLMAPIGDGPRAAAITRIYDFNITGFNPGGISPVDPWSGIIKITFDPAVDVVGPAVPDYFASNLPASYGAFVFAYTAATHRFSVCNNWAGACAAGAGFDRAIFQFTAADPDAPVFLGATIGSQASPQSLAITGNGSVTLHTGPDPSQVVPEPASLALLGMGLAVLGWTRSRRR